ncbi:MAG: TetR/AcrR family transcriptional regulator [Planctomycetes bacterium]|nr:TetR/AcrR family transcriptional regulator [Planctomycetota bacterium]
MDKNKLPRREREKLLHREEILEAALSLFSSKGFHNVSMKDIANESEFGVGTLYNFFDSKELLFIELMKVGIEKIGQLLIPILDSNQQEQEKLSEFIRVHVDMIEGNIELIKLYISQYGMSTSVSPMLKDILNLKIIVAAKLESLIKAGIQKQIFRRVHPEIVALSLRATLEAFVFECFANFNKTKVKKKLSRIEEFFLNALLTKKQIVNQNNLI